MKNLNSFTLGIWCATVSICAHSACYTIYKGEQVVYQSIDAPIDMSKPFGQTVPNRFGIGAVMVFHPSSDACLPVVELRNSNNAGGNVQASLDILDKSSRANALPYQALDRTEPRGNTLGSSSRYRANFGRDNTTRSRSETSMETSAAQPVVVRFVRGSNAAADAAKAAANAAATAAAAAAVKK